jgi:LmbE family N-acetylglucosaminyl deacetylase
MKKVVLLLFLLALVAGGGYIFNLWSLTAEETYPEDTFLKNTPNKTALILVAHDDDAVGCAGTASKLVQSGWTVNFVCYYGKRRPKEIPVRKAEMRQAGQVAGMQQVDLIDFEMMNGIDTIANPWDAIPYERFPQRFKEDSIQYQVAQVITRYKPTVIFTLDDEMGSTGNPAHVALSRAIREFCRQSKNQPGFPVQRIYHPVYPPSLQKNILDKSPAFTAAKKVYKTQGLPAPHVAVDITEVAEKKKQIMRSLASQHQSLKKMWPYYKWYPGWLYFRIFDKEYFRVISI